MKIIDTLFALEGKVALMTGAGSGIGRAMASDLAAAGAAVVHVARRPAPLEEAVGAIVAGRGKAAWTTADMERIDALPSLVQAAAAFFGDPDILVNAAGINLREAWDVVSEASWTKTLTVNLTAPFFLARLLVPAMKARAEENSSISHPCNRFAPFPTVRPTGHPKGGSCS